LCSAIAAHGANISIMPPPIRARRRTLIAPKMLALLKLSAAIDGRASILESGPVGHSPARRRRPHATRRRFFGHRAMSPARASAARRFGDRFQ
jgi:hypothetical protein